MCATLTYAYFSATILGNSDNKNTKIDMSKMKLEFSDKTGKVVADNINPGWTYQKKVSVTNTGDVPVKYDLVWLNLQNEIEQDEMVYSITCDNCNGIDESPVPSYGGENLKILTNTIEKDAIQEYTINFTFKETNASQNYNQNKVFTGNIGIKENNTYEEVQVGILSDTDWEYTLDEENNKVMLTYYKGTNPNVEIYPTYIKDNKQYKTVIKKYSTSSGKITTLFVKDANIFINHNLVVEKVKFMGNVEFENNDMGDLFYACFTLKEIDITKLDFSKIISVASWLSYCDAIINQDQIKGFDNLSKLTNMNGIFRDLRKIQNLNLKSWDTSKVTNMSFMFAYCLSLTSIDLSSFNTSKVTTMYCMFHSCRNLNNIDLSSFDTTNVINMNSMFATCVSLNTIDMSHFNTVKVTNISMMFYNCNSLVNVNLSSFDTSKVTDMSNMFYGCSALKKLNIAKFNYSTIKNANCYPSFDNVPTDIEVTTNETVKSWLNENYPDITNITVV